ncbi:Pleiotropic drug resistance protein [Corchorus olitorius]|uniref:Pleiotropic drug resistance protein n=1 Tax=Corchorus olitorius TaxID=93759 RepID=A0A1R3JTS6_9ROSI|nr:Pleiotropic drug resistance protein [Corchorus olitorius]
MLECDSPSFGDLPPLMVGDLPCSMESSFCNLPPSMVSILQCAIYSLMVSDRHLCILILPSEGHFSFARSTFFISAIGVLHYMIYSFLNFSFVRSTFLWCAIFARAFYSLLRCTHHLRDRHFNSARSSFVHSLLDPFEGFLVSRTWSRLVFIDRSPPGITGPIRGFFIRAWWRLLVACQPVSLDPQEGFSPFRSRR